MKKKKTVTEVSRAIGVAKTTLMYWWLTGVIPEPEKVGGARVWSPYQVRKVKEFAQMKQEKKEKRGEK